MQQDFILRIIRLIIRNLARAMGLIQEERYEEANALIDQEFEGLTGLNMKTVDDMSPESLAFMLKLNNDHYHLLAMASILFHKGFSQEKEGHQGRAIFYLRCSSAILKSIDQDFQDTDSQEGRDKLAAELRQRGLF